MIAFLIVMFIFLVLPIAWIEIAGRKWDREDEQGKGRYHG